MNGWWVRWDWKFSNEIATSPHLTVFLNWWAASAPRFVPEELALSELFAPSALWLLGIPALLTTRWLRESPWPNHPGSPPIPACASLIHLSNKWWGLNFALSKFAMHCSIIYYNIYNVFMWVVAKMLFLNSALLSLFFWGLLQSLHVRLSKSRASTVSASSLPAPTLDACCCQAPKFKDEVKEADANGAELRCFLPPPLMRILKLMSLFLTHGDTQQYRWTCILDLQQQHKTTIYSLWIYVYINAKVRKACDDTRDAI